MTVSSIPFCDVDVTWDGSTSFHKPCGFNILQRGGRFGKSFLTKTWSEPEMTSFARNFILFDDEALGSLCGFCLELETCTN